MQGGNILLSQEEDVNASVAKVADVIADFEEKSYLRR